MGGRRRTLNKNKGMRHYIIDLHVTSDAGDDIDEQFIQNALDKVDAALLLGVQLGRKILSNEWHFEVRNMRVMSIEERVEAHRMGRIEIKS